MVGTAAHYENFPVASPLLPAGMRRHVAALYAFARAADDFADEGARSQAERLTLLHGWQQRLRASVASDVPGPPPRDGEPADTVALFVALGASIRDRGLPVSLFEDLLSAFRQDVTTTRYGTWKDLLDYCRRSANPVGRLVLRIAMLRVVLYRGLRAAYFLGAASALGAADFLPDFLPLLFFAPFLTGLSAFCVSLFFISAFGASAFFSCAKPVAETVANTPAMRMVNSLRMMFPFQCGVVTN